MGLKEIGWEGMDWIHLAQYTDQRWDIVNMTLHLRVPSNCGSFLSS
jgi:hypothetical protein